MLKEIEKAVELFRNMMFGNINASEVPKHKLDVFVSALTDILKARYENCWFPGNPERGSAYRCIRINRQSIDPVIVKSLRRAKIDFFDKLMSTELTIWVDPGVVSVRIGEDGSIGPIVVDEQVYNMGRQTNTVANEQSRPSLDEELQSLSSSPQSSISNGSQSDSPGMTSFPESNKYATSSSYSDEGVASCSPSPQSSIASDSVNPSTSSFPHSNEHTTYFSYPDEGIAFCNSSSQSSAYTGFQSASQNTSTGPDTDHHPDCPLYPGSEFRQAIPRSDSFYPSFYSYPHYPLMGQYHETNEPQISYPGEGTPSWNSSPQSSTDTGFQYASQNTSPSPDTDHHPDCPLHSGPEFRQAIPRSDDFYPSFYSYPQYPLMGHYHESTEPQISYPDEGTAFFNSSPQSSTETGSQSASQNTSSDAVTDQHPVCSLHATPKLIPRVRRTDIFYPSFYPYPHYRLLGSYYQTSSYILPEMAVSSGTFYSNFVSHYPYSVLPSQQFSRENGLNPTAAVDQQTQEVSSSQCN